MLIIAEQSWSLLSNADQFWEMMNKVEQYYLMLRHAELCKLFLTNTEEGHTLLKMLDTSKSFQIELQKLQVTWAEFLWYLISDFYIFVIIWAWYWSKYFQKNSLDDK